MSDCNNCNNLTDGLCCHLSIKPSTFIKDVKQEVTRNIEQQKERWHKRYGGGILDELERQKQI